MVKAFVSGLLRITRLELWPVRVRSGIAQGARWTLYPWSAYWRGTQEPQLHQALLQLGDITGWTCWDLGAHFGIYSVGLARRVGVTGQVAAFEPNPVSHARLVRHARMNRLDWLKVFPAAVSDDAGSAELYTYGSLQSTTTHLPYEGESAGTATAPITIRTVVLDDLVSKGEIRAPDLIKVDVEGHGHKALAGARRSLSARRPILIVAFHSQVEVDGVLALLTPLGYTSTPLEPVAGSGGTMIGRDYLFRPATLPAGADPAG